MLGVPLGSLGFTARRVREKLLGKLSETLCALADFEDSQAAFYLLRVSYSAVRATHFMHTTPLEGWAKEAEEFDAGVRRGA